MGAVRQRFAKAIVRKERISSRRLLQALGSVRRERFVGEGPWRLRSVVRSYWSTLDSDPVHLYEDVMVALDERRGIDNGLPSLWARIFSLLDIEERSCVVQIGCGTGYYSAILSYLVGPKGRVIAIDSERLFVEEARKNLRGQRNVKVVYHDGREDLGLSADVVVVHAGFSHAHRVWLDALRPDGRLLVPITNRLGQGTLFKITRLGAQYCAEAIGPIQIMPSRRDGFVIDKRLLRWWEANSQVRSVRLDAHKKDGTCWLHWQGACLSKRRIAKS